MRTNAANRIIARMPLLTLDQLQAVFLATVQCLDKEAGDEIGEGRYHDGLAITGLNTLAETLGVPGITPGDDLADTRDEVAAATSNHYDYARTVDIAGRTSRMHSAVSALLATTYGFDAERRIDPNSIAWAHTHGGALHLIEHPDGCVTFTKAHRDICPFITSSGTEDCDDECAFECPVDVR
jgi:hypothetical protein